MFNPLTLQVAQMGLSALSGNNPLNNLRNLLDQAQNLARGAQDLAQNLARMGLENNGCGDDYSAGGSRGSRGGKSWLQAIAQMLGKIADQKAQELQQAADAISGGGNNPSALTDFQVKAQEFSMLMNTIVGALKSMGEGISAAAQASTR